MKKVLITMAVLTSMVAGGMVFSSFVAPKQEKVSGAILTIPSNGPGCVQVGNCSVEISSDHVGYYVRAYNYNNYRVTVSYSVYGYDNQGQRRKVCGGVMSLGTDDSSNNSKLGIDRFDTTCSDLSLEDVSVSRCD